MIQQGFGKASVFRLSRLEPFFHRNKANQKGPGPLNPLPVETNSTRTLNFPQGRGGLASKNTRGPM
jgi:hypothetical protein